MTTEKDISVRLFATREEMDVAYILGEMLPGQVFALEGIDPEVLQDFLDFEWTDADESSLEFDEQEI